MASARTVRTVVASGEKVAVWGGNGFVGSRVCKELVSRVSHLSHLLVKQSFETNGSLWMELLCIGAEHSSKHLLMRVFVSGPGRDTM